MTQFDLANGMSRATNMLLGLTLGALFTLWLVKRYGPFGAVEIVKNKVTPILLAIIVLLILAKIVFLALTGKELPF